MEFIEWSQALIASSVGIVATVTNLILSLYLENRRLRKDMSEAQSRIQVPTPDEVRKYARPSWLVKGSAMLTLILITGALTVDVTRLTFVGGGGHPRFIAPLPRPAIDDLPLVHLLGLPVLLGVIAGISVTLVAEIMRRRAAH